jgi:hypothetical protein
MGMALLSGDKESRAGASQEIVGEWLGRESK